VIAALNSDKPFDRFILEQLAGDLLPFDTPAQRAEHLVATFLAIGPKTLNERSGLKFELDLVDEHNRKRGHSGFCPVPFYEKVE
jgi:hypothetical protein